MKISFVFTDEYDLAQVPAGGRFRSNFEVPDAAKSLPDIQARLIAIAELVGQLTWANVHLTCPDIGLKDHPIRLTTPQKKGELVWTTHTCCLYFAGIAPFSQYGRIWNKPIKCVLTIHAPVNYPKSEETERIIYHERVKALSDQLLMLLNTDIPSQTWQFDGFNASVWQQTLHTRAKKRGRKIRSEEYKQEHEEEKRKAREAKLAEKRAANPQPQQPLTHGAGRTVGARPGIYGGVQMRSQLEIRFAAELDERGIKWLYESEALSASSYLVDFYLPDLDAWVEVKGKFEARDRQVLPEVAKYLKAERQHRLLVYTGSGKCSVVNPSGFREVERKNFWTELMR